MNLNKKKIIDFYIGGALLALLKLPVVSLGKLLKRNHNNIPQGDIVIIKMLGGGSLLLAFEGLLKLRKCYPERKIKLLTTNACKPFAESLNVFDEIIVIQDKSLFQLIFSSLNAWRTLFRIDTVIDLEVHSRLTTVYSLITCARNRLGFFRESVFWRKHFYTHTTYFNLFFLSSFFYEEIIGELLSKNEEVNIKSHFITENKLKKGQELKYDRVITVGHNCSELGKERVLTPLQWKKTASLRISKNENILFKFLGAPNDSKLAEQISNELNSLNTEGFQINTKNLCGELKLVESIQEIYRSTNFWGIDSALLHFARLLEIDCLSIWGPTSPHTRLKESPNFKEEVIYKQIECSPCIHITETPPCHGNNRCIKNLF